MPVKGRQRKAKPFDVFLAYAEHPLHPSPSKHETFKGFVERLDGNSDNFLRMLIEEGYGEPSRQEYIRRLDDLSESLNRLRSKLFSMWPKQ